MSIKDATQRLHLITQIRQHLIALSFSTYRRLAHVIVILLFNITAITLPFLLHEATQIHVTYNSGASGLSVSMQIFAVQVIHEFYGVKIVMQFLLLG